MDPFPFLFQLAALVDFLHEPAVGSQELVCPFAHAFLEIVPGLADLLPFDFQEVFHEKVATAVELDQVAGQHPDEIGADKEKVVVK